MIKSFSGKVVFCFAILRAISAYVGENWLSQYMTAIYSKLTFILVNGNWLSSKQPEQTELSETQNYAYRYACVFPGTHDFR